MPKHAGLRHISAPVHANLSCDFFAEVLLQCRLFKQGKLQTLGKINPVALLQKAEGG